MILESKLTAQKTLERTWSTDLKKLHLVEPISWLCAQDLTTSLLMKMYQSVMYPKKSSVESQRQT